MKRSPADGDLQHVRRRTAAAFAATLIGLVGLTLLSVFNLDGLADTVSEVAERQSPAIEQLAEIRGAILRARAGTRDAIAAPSERRARIKSEVLDSLHRLDGLLDQYSTVGLDSPQELVDITNAVHGTRDAVLAAFARLDAGDASGATAVLDQTRAATEHADRALQAGLVHHSEGAKRVAAWVRSALRRFIYEVVVLTLIGFLGAFVLLRLSGQALRQALDSMTARQEASERRATELDAFAARVAHDLRSPLTVTRISLGQISRRVPPELALQVQRSKHSIDVLDGMISELLEFARSGASPGPEAACDVASVASALLAETQARAESLHVQLTTELPGSLRARIGEGSFRIVAGNVIENALKYMGDGPTRQIDVKLFALPDGIHFHVRDTGVGIPAEALPRIYEPFFRATSSASGYGLGLATVKRVVEAHGGQIAVQSAPGSGTTVEIVLVAIPDKRRSPPPAQAA